LFYNLLVFEKEREIYIIMYIDLHNIYKKIRINKKDRYGF